MPLPSVFSSLPIYPPCCFLCFPYSTPRSHIPAPYCHSLVIFLSLPTFISCSDTQFYYYFTTCWITQSIYKSLSPSYLPTFLHLITKFFLSPLNLDSFLPPLLQLQFPLCNFVPVCVPVFLYVSSIFTFFTDLPCFITDFILEVIMSNE